MKNFFSNYLIEIMLSAGFFIAAAILNLQLLEGSNINFTFAGHDEYLTVYEVNSILNPPSFKHFFMAIVSGNVLFYGRIMFYVDALFAFLPYKVWGISGMVYAIRMTHVTFIIAGALILSYTFLRSHLAKLFFFSTLMTLYYTVYFVMIPKPEPLQLFLLAIFLYHGYKHNWRFGKHFIFLGMAYGVKFNMLTLLPLFFILPFFQASTKFKSLLSSGLYWFAGLIIAVPALLLAPVKPIFLKSYIASTFGNTSHYDDTGATTLDWIKKGWFDVYSGGGVFGVLMCILIAWVLIAAVRTFFYTRQINPSVVLLLIGLSIFIPVILLTKRMWPHYLWSGYLFLSLGLAAFTQNDFRSKIQERFYSLVLMILLIGTLVNATRRIPVLFDLEAESAELIDVGKKVRIHLAKGNSHYTAIQDLSVYYPFKDFLEIRRYHPFASTSPFREPAQKYVWSPFINPSILSTEKSDFLIVYSRDFEKLHKANVSLHDKLVLKEDSVMRTQLGKTIILDTIIGKVKVYRLVNGNL